MCVGLPRGVLWATWVGGGVFRVSWGGLGWEMGEIACFGSYLTWCGVSMCSAMV
jgi:hypothetical protein